MLCRNLLFKSGVTVEKIEKKNFDQIIEPQTRKIKYICCFLGGSKYPQQQIDVFRKLWYHTLVSDLCVLQSNLR